MRSSLIMNKDFLDSVRIPIRLACKTTSNWPIVLSLWFLHQNGLLYLATKKSAKVVKYISHDPQVGFEIAEDRPPYCGIRGQGVARIDETIGVEILEKLLVRYLGDTNNSLAKKLLANAEDEVAIVLEPVKVFTWDFSHRMEALDATTGDFQAKVCPDRGTKIKI